LKTLERLIDTHIRLTTNPSLHAYCKGRSTDTALHSLVSRMAAFLDNNVTPTAITDALTELGIGRPIVGLIHTMLTSRVVFSTMGSTHSTRTVGKRNPQGGVLLPLLWVIVVNKLLSLLEEAGT